MGDEESEQVSLAALAAAHLRHELDLGNCYLPQVSAAESAAAEAAPAAAAPTAGDGAPRRSSAGDLPSLVVLAEQAASCTRCGLHSGRTKSVFSRGSERASLVFVGEGPGLHEDQSGSPFVGNAGQLLDKMIRAMGFGPEEVYICNVVKCRPPDNRTPTAEEAAACMPYLRAQLASVAPEVVVALGRHAADNLGLTDPASGWRGRWGAFAGIQAMPTYHPAYLLRSPEKKRAVWRDLQSVVKMMGRSLPGR